MTYTIGIDIGERKFTACWGRSKKQAEQEAALIALRELGLLEATASGEFQSCLAAPADSIGPGATALTRILWRAHSTASVCVIDMTPALAAL